MSSGREGGGHGAGARDPSPASRDDRDVHHRHLRRAIALAEGNRARGGRPFGSLLGDALGTVLAVEVNSVHETGDLSRHPELLLAVLARRDLPPEISAGTTLYTSCEPCPMCTGAIFHSGLGRVVFSLSAQRLREPGRRGGAGPSPPVSRTRSARVRSRGWVGTVPDPTTGEDARRR